MSNPLAEVFGYPTTSQSSQAQRHRANHLCPFGNLSPNCTKDKKADPLGVCSVLHGGRPVVTCPVRFRDSGLVVEQAAQFLFPGEKRWTALPEVRLKDANGKSAGNIDYVIVAYDSKGRVTDFGAVEVQAVYISGNVRSVFEAYMENPQESKLVDWSSFPHSPRPDYLSSSRKRLAPQLLYKGGILASWGKRQIVVTDLAFFSTLPPMEQVGPEHASIAWHVYDLKLDSASDQFRLVQDAAYYTSFETALDRLTQTDAPPIESFFKSLQSLFNKRSDHATISTIAEALNPIEAEVDPDVV